MIGVSVQSNTLFVTSKECCSLLSQYFVFIYIYMQSYCMYNGLSQHGAIICDYPSAEAIDLIITDFTALYQRHCQFNSDLSPMHGGPSDALSLLQACIRQVSFANIKVRNEANMYLYSSFFFSTFSICAVDILLRICLLQNFRIHS